jgi:hypothetical protein
VNDRCQYFLLAFLDGQFQHFGGVGQAALQGVQRGNDIAEPGAFAAQRLRAFRVVPDAGIFQFTVDFLEPVPFPGIVKDTP